METPAQRNALRGLFVISLGFALWALSVGWDHSLLDRHGFRQTQTALTTYSLLQGGPWIAYETPVLGAPWAIPLEFPLYQWLVALIVRATGIELDAAGRLMSATFYLLSLLPAWSILGFLRVAKTHRLVFLSLFLVNPIYLFWSRTFLIESTALFLSLTYLMFVGRYLRRRRPTDGILATIFGTLAALVKVMTFTGFSVAAAIFVLMNWLRVHRGRISIRILLEQWVPVVCFALVPVAVTQGWIVYCDDVKSLNPIAADNLLSWHMTRWNFGTLEQRLDPATWMRFVDRIPLYVGHGAVLVAALGATLASPRAWLPVLASVGLFLGVFLTFTNLHHVHDYYQYANTIFLLSAIGFSIRALLERKSRVRWAGVVALALTLSAFASAYGATYLQAQRSDSHYYRSLAREIQKSTDPEDVILIWGADWSSEIPYLARRRALMFPPWLRSPLDGSTTKWALKELSTYRIGAMVICGPSREKPQYIRERATLLNMIAKPSFDGDRCQLHTPIHSP